MASQLVELIWRNRAYQDGISDPDGVSDYRVGAMFGGFRTEMGFDNEKRIPEKKVRQEYISYDRVCAYPGRVQDSKFAYDIGPTAGCDPASMDLPAQLQMPRTVATDVHDAAKERKLDFRAGLYSQRVRREVRGDEDGRTEIVAPEDGDYAKGMTNPIDADIGKGRDGDGRPTHFLNPGMMVRKRPLYSEDDVPISNEYAAIKYVDDIDYSNAGDTSVDIDLNETISGVNCVLKKIVIQCSKSDHHISELTVDFSDITRGSGSITSSENPQCNQLTIMLDGKKKLHTAYFDCKMGKFGASKFKLGIKDVRYFPPMSNSAGGFDAGSQIAPHGAITMRAEKQFEPATYREMGMPPLYGFTTTNPGTDDIAAELDAQGVGMGFDTRRFDESGGIYARKTDSVSARGAAPDPRHMFATKLGAPHKIVPLWAERYPTQAWPNTLNREPSVYGSGASNVADAVNAGFDLRADTVVDGEVVPETNPVAPIAGVTVLDTGTKEQVDVEWPRSLNVGTTHDWTTNQTVRNDSNPMMSNAAIRWHRAGCSNYEFRPRESRGTLLAVCITMQADQSM